MCKVCDYRSWKNITGDDERSFLVHGHCLPVLRGELKIFHTEFRDALKKNHSKLRWKLRWKDALESALE